MSHIDEHYAQELIDTIWNFGPDDNLDALRLGLKQIPNQILNARTGSGGMSFLWLAAIYEHYEMVDLLICAGADCNIVDDCGQSPLLMTETISIANLLLCGGADCCIASVSGYTPLYFAVQDNRMDFVKLFLFFGADKSIYTLTTYNESSPINSAKKYGREKILDILMRWPIVPPLVVFCLRVVRVNKTKTETETHGHGHGTCYEWPDIEEVLE